MAPGDWSSDVCSSDLRKLKISLPQLRYVTNSNEGEGLLFFGNTIVPFIDKFPKDTILYQKMTTKPEEVR